MIIRPFSDLHVDVYDFHIPPMPSDPETILVLAGDIRNDRRALKYVLRHAERFLAIIFVLGNHEFYKESFVTLASRLKQEAEKSCNNVFVLENDWVDIDHARVIGTTLWTDFGKGDMMSLHGARLGMNDFSSIRTGSAAAPYVRRLSPRDALLRHLDARGWLADTIASAHRDERVPVVVTHHGPTLEHEDPAYRGSGVSGAYVSDMSDFILRHRPRLWISGHTHFAMNTVLGITTMVSNPRGYSPHSLVSGFDPWLSIRVDGEAVSVCRGLPTIDENDDGRLVRRADLSTGLADLLERDIPPAADTTDGWRVADVKRWIRSVVVGTRER